jgi:hypothetical protein
MYHHWDELENTENAAGYDINLRWVASKPWIRVVTPDQIAAGEIDVTGDGVGDSWYVIDRGSPSLQKTSHDWLDHATQEDYDQWYLGSSGREEGLSDRIFNIRPGVPVGMKFGMQSLNDNLLADRAWDAVSAMSSPGGRLGRIARATAHSATLLTAFHNQTNNDLSKYSTGAYIEPDYDYNTLSEQSSHAQSQMRFAAVYREVELWASSPPATATAVAQDIDLDGAVEYLLKNDRVFAVFEASGGRLTAAWARDTVKGEVYQVVGNFLSYSGSDTEEEGDSNVLGSDVGAYRTSGFKDWFASGPETNAYVNDLYAVAVSGSSGWEFTSSDGKVQKLISLADNSNRLAASYQLSGDVTGLFVRFGMSPHLDDLLTHGQRNLVAATDDGSRVMVRNVTPTVAVNAAVYYSSAAYNPSATDKAAPVFMPDTLNMRNQAQTEQVELESVSTSFSLELELSAVCADCDSDGLPDDWEVANGLDPNDDGTVDVNNGPSGNPDGDRMDNATEYLLGLNPQLADDHLFPKLTAIVNADQSVTLDFATNTDRRYRLWWSDNLVDWYRMGADIVTLDEPPVLHEQRTDDGYPHTPIHPSETDGRFYKLEIMFP